MCAFCRVARNEFSGPEGSVGSIQLRLFPRCRLVKGATDILEKEPSFAQYTIVLNIARIAVDFGQAGLIWAQFGSVGLRFQAWQEKRFFMSSVIICDMQVGKWARGMFVCLLIFGY